MSRTLGWELSDAPGLREAAVERYWSDVRRYFGRRVTSSMDADDLVQEVCLRFLSGDATCPPRPLPYLYGIATHVLADYRRNQRRERGLIVSDSDLLDDTGLDAIETTTSADQIGSAQLLTRALSQLPPKHCSVLLAHKRDGLTYQETAQKLGLSVHTVEKYLTQARAQLRLTWED